MRNATAANSPAQGNHGAQASAAAGTRAASAGAPTKPDRVYIPADTLTPRHHRNSDWHVVVPAGITGEDLHLNPAACALISHKLLRGDNLVAITSDDKRLITLVCVMGDMGTTAMCAVTAEFDLSTYQHEDGDSIPAGCGVRMVNAQDCARHGMHPGQWIGVRLEDDHVMTEGKHSKVAAVEALQQHAAFRDGKWKTRNGAH